MSLTSLPIATRVLSDDQLVTADERAALDAVGTALSADNPVATIADIPVLGYRWVDLPGPVTALPLQGQSGDPDRDLDGSLLFDASSVEQISQLYQLAHGTKLDTPANLHLHWAKSTAAAGDVVWQMRYRTWRAGAAPTEWSEWAARSGRSEAVAGDLREIIDWWSVDISALADSAHINAQFRRLATDGGDTYAADAKLWSADAHIQVYEHPGSVLEFPELPS